MKDIKVVRRLHSHASVNDYSPSKVLREGGGKELSCTRALSVNLAGVYTALRRAAAVNQLSDGW